MKNYSLIPIILALVLSSCQSNDQNEHLAFDKVKQDKESQVAVPEVEAKTIATIPTAEKVLQVDSFQYFYNEITRNITINEAKIKELKSRPNINIKVLKKVTILEKANNEMRLELEEFEKRKKEEWKAFKLELRKQSNSISSDFSEIDSKK